MSTKVKLTKTEKQILENIMEQEIRASINGINTRLLNGKVFRTLKSQIPNLNMHHVAGMLSWVSKAYGHVFLVRTPGYSIIK